MKNILLLAAGTFIGILSYAQGGKVIDDKNAQKRSVSGFHAINISAGIDLYLSQGGEEAVAVSAANTGDRDRIRTEVRDGVLHIFMDTEGMHWGIRGDRKLRAYVSCKVMNGLHSSGGSDIFLEDLLKAERLDVDLSGGSDMRGKVELQDLQIVQTGGSDSYLTGSAAKLTISASGGSDLHGYDLAAGEVHIVASGGSDVHVTAEKALFIVASGGSDVYYKGAGVVKASNASGSSSITKKG